MIASGTEVHSSTITVPRVAAYRERLKVNTSPLVQLGSSPYYLPLSGLNGGRPLVGGRLCYDLASNDYLGLASDPRIHEAMAHAIQECGASQCGTPIATGYAPVLMELEAALARFVGLEASVVLPSCYQANTSLFPCIARPEDMILVDRCAHASLVQGIRAVGCKIRPFRHNDLGHLEGQLTRSTACRQTFVVTESVFSTEGSIAPIVELTQLCERFGAVPVIDDSHGIGVLGATGRGVLEHLNISRYPGVYTASLGKALAGAGGMIAGDRELIEFLRYSCPGLIYSTALPPASAAGVLKAVEIICDEFRMLGAALWSNHRRMVDLLKAQGFKLSPGGAPIAAIQCGSIESTLRLAQELMRRRVLSTPFVPPSVPEDGGVVRLIVGAKLDAFSLQEALDGVTGMGLSEFVGAAKP